MTDLRSSTRADLLDTVSARHGGLIPAAALRESGLNSHAVEALVRDGSLVRPRRGLYVQGETWRSADPDERYRLYVRATAAVAARPIVVSHLSAASMHGLPTIGHWPRTVHTLDLDASGGSSAQHQTSHRGGPDPELQVIAGVLVTSLARTLIDVAAATSFLVGVVMIDDALRVDQERVAAAARRGILLPAALTKADLFAELAAVNPRFGARQADRAIEFANALSANGGESMSRVRIFQLGFEVPELQVPFRNIEGSDYWVDYYWRRVRKIGEFDGMQKYTRGRVLAGRDPGEVVWREKRREDALRRHSDSFDRWDWDTAFSPVLFDRFLRDRGVPRA
ncbi:type IV toxin-antitoxin system AbiEi family antitoxin domain-containing protein [Cryobacterium sp. PH31-AA6]|uniref:type IV toxin-antitoxin system AbiEi family antitoxin domain-containing protein n=1 Tax=Cryobacterium sp. PH31-AA6 TaxID=3046205 RepID=UPI0024BAE701|nr:type IV toxin-antitoxin system AbiEi family antitoxin domain-containing protein [Cryobacterium sp. PH31-AA6]MDJ0323397.1 type IV toxin-antitoxin system AbiEi family antitoxin domain-containing protein [Cryobacterium sp. PH31-AA6]